MDRCWLQLAGVTEPVEHNDPQNDRLPGGHDRRYDGAQLGWLAGNDLDARLIGSVEHLECTAAIAVDCHDHGFGALADESGAHAQRST